MPKHLHLRLLAAIAILALAPSLFAAYTGRAAMPIEPRARAIGYLSAPTATAYRSSLSSADTGDVTEGGTGLGTVTSISTGGYQTVAVTGLASVSTATFTLTCVRYAYDSANSAWVGVSTTDATAAAASEFTEGGAYFTPSVYFDTEGAALVKVFVKSISTGTIDLYAQVN